MSGFLEAGSWGKSGGAVISGDGGGSGIQARSLNVPASARVASVIGDTAGGGLDAETAMKNALEVLRAAASCHSKGVTLAARLSSYQCFLLVRLIDDFRERLEVAVSVLQDGVAA